MYIAPPVYLLGGSNFDTLSHVILVTSPFFMVRVYKSGLAMQPQIKPTWNPKLYRDS